MQWAGTLYGSFCLFVCLFMLMLNAPVKNCSVMSGRGHHFLGIFNSTFRGVHVSLLKDTAVSRRKESICHRNLVQWAGTVHFVCLFVLMSNVPFNNFSVLSGRGHHFLGIFISTFRGVNVSLLKDTTGRL